MLIDARTVDRNRRIEADLCVIGSGPAGITLLKQMASPDLRVVCLESGAGTFDPQAQDLCDGTTISAQGYTKDLVITSRRRQLGGTAHLWNDEFDAGKGNELVRLVPLDPIDFEKRDWMPLSGWPFSKATLDPFYEQALAFAGVDSSNGIQRAGERRQLLPESARIATVLSRFGVRAAFTNEHPAALAADPNVTIYLNATVLELAVRDGKVEHARVSANPGSEFQVSAPYWVLAAGGIENARILLLSNRDQPNGLGNQYDVVGRCFMDHPSFRLGVLTPSDPSVFGSAGLYDHHLLDDSPVMGKLTFRDQVMRSERMLNICVYLTPRDRAYESPITKMAKTVLRSSSPAAAIKTLRDNLGMLIRGSDELMVAACNRLARTQLTYFEHKGGWSRLPTHPRHFRRFEMRCLAEQAPNPANRVTLGRDVDRFGQRKTELHWSWSDIDLESIGRAQEILKEECKTHQLGEFVTQREFDRGAPPYFSSPHHHLGTTRMHSDARHGVVDPDCKIHGLPNLYVAGSSVFPTGGFANPTLTIIALAIRLSYHLKELMKPARSPLCSTTTPGASASE
ncbi:MAG TPA: GMC family oxidoreductase [Chthoniobacterales bacterium]|nr:GMC family oxidoreductase [Chthoniobacterales bacterium]